MNVFDGLLGYEKLMLLCGFILFVFALVVIAVLIAQKRDFKLAMVLIIFAIVLMGFPGIQVVKFNQGIVEIDKIRAQPSAPADPAQKEAAQQVLGRLAQRAEGNPQLQAKISDGYRAIGEVDKAYQLAQSLLKKNPSAQVQATLVPVLTAKLNEVQATAPLPTSGSAGGQGATAAPGTTGGSARTPASVAPKATQQQIASIAIQLQDTGATLPAASHAALARAYVVLGQPQKAQANVDAALKLNPGIKINADVLHAARAGSLPERTQP
jgi:tetratricopeptide (TPR) repeat protein